MFGEATAGKIGTMGGLTMGVEPRTVAMEDVGGVIPSGADHRLLADRVSRDFGGAKERLWEPRGREGHKPTQRQKDH